MILIHGGAFYFGSSNSGVYGADYLVEQGVVLVTINYRLGPQGWTFNCAVHKALPKTCNIWECKMSSWWPTVIFRVTSHNYGFKLFLHEQGFWAWKMKRCPEMPVWRTKWWLCVGFSRTLSSLEEILVMSRFSYRALEVRVFSITCCLLCQKVGVV